MSRLTGYKIICNTFLVGSLIITLAKMSDILCTSGDVGWQFQIPVIAYCFMIASFSIGVYLIYSGVEEQR